MSKIHAPFASRDYDAETHEKVVTDVSSWESLTRIKPMIENAVAWYIEHTTWWNVRMTEIRMK